jgi:transcriptional regulator with PAS, ATPase and Fis domain
MKNGAPQIPADDILASMAEAVFTVDGAWRITSFNHGAEVLTGRPGRDVLGSRCYEVFRSTLCAAECPLKKALAAGAGTGLVRRAVMVNGRGQQVPVTVSAAVLRDCKGVVVGGVETVQDLRRLDEGKIGMDRAVQACEVQTIIAALSRNKNNRAATARELGIHKSTFFRKIKNLGIDLPCRDGRFRADGR